MSALRFASPQLWSLGLADCLTGQGVHRSSGQDCTARDRSSCIADAGKHVCSDYYSAATARQAAGIEGSHAQLHVEPVQSDTCFKPQR